MVTAASTARRAHVFIVDDDAMMVRVCRRYLRDYEVSSAKTMPTAVEEIAAARPDVILLDFNLGPTTGAQMIPEIRRRGVDVPILLTSGSFESHRGADEFSFGADDILAKPFTRESLLAKLERLLAAHALEREAAEQREALVALNERRDREVHTARDLLSRMVARSQFDARSARYDQIPCGDFSGDLVLGADVGNGRFRWLVGDVTGHTLASALVTIPVSMIFYATARKAVPLEEVLRTFEQELATLLPVSMFVAATMCELDRNQGLLHVFNGGGPPLVLHQGGQISTVSSDNLPLAVLRSENAQHEISTVRVSAGDRIYTFSDGLTEAMSASGEMLGVEAVLHALGDGPVDEAYERLLAVWRAHVGFAAVSDDVSTLELIV
jgi:serine phosphatase RsbU (regulator of sigma subunit)